MPKSDYWYCPVDDCEWWVALSGYTEQQIRAMKRHVDRDHSDLSGVARRRDGGIVDDVLAKALRRTREEPVDA